MLQANEVNSNVVVLPQSGRGSVYDARPRYSRTAHQAAAQGHAILTQGHPAFRQGQVSPTGCATPYDVTDNAHALGGFYSHAEAVHSALAARLAGGRAGLFADLRCECALALA